MGVISLLVVVSPSPPLYHFFLFYLHVIVALVSQNCSLIHHTQPPNSHLTSPHTHIKPWFDYPHTFPNLQSSSWRALQLSQHVIIPHTPYPLFISTLTAYLSPHPLSLSFFSTWRWHHTRWTAHMTDPNLILLQQHQWPASILFNATSDVFFI